MSPAISSDSPGQRRSLRGIETHTRTAEVTIDLMNVPGIEQDVISSLKNHIIRVPVTQAVIYGWYDNEMGSYVNIMGDRTVTVADNM